MKEQTLEPMDSRDCSYCDRRELGALLAADFVTSVFWPPPLSDVAVQSFIALDALAALTEQKFGRHISIYSADVATSIACACARLV